MRAPSHDLCVVGGGHVGAPLALVLAGAGFRVLVHDRNRAALDMLAGGSMPFREAGGETLLRRALHAGNLAFTADPAALDGISDVLIAIDTAEDEFRNPATGRLMRCIGDLWPYLPEGACVVLRSTLAPGFTAFAERDLARRGKRVLLAYCPERSAEGHAIEELRTIPQLVGAASAEGLERARALFAKIAPEIVAMSPLEAEYAKLLCNAYRYIRFAAANELCAMVESAGLDYHRMLDALKRGYPRMDDVPRAGFAAGPCLRPDTLKLLGGGSMPIAEAAVAVNAGMPERVAADIAGRCVLDGAQVGILGTAFKAESDDVRGSLSYELGAALAARGAVVRYSDEHVRDPVLVEKNELVAGSDIVIVAVPHRGYRGLKIPEGKIVVDTCDGLRA